MSNLPEIFVITRPTTCQFRTARSVDGDLSRAILQVCERNKNVRSCFLLDARLGEGAEIKLVIAVLLDDDEVISLQLIAAQLQEVLCGFPEIAKRTSIMSASTFEKEFSAKEFYLRQK